MNLWWRYLFGGLVVAGIASAILPRATAESFPLELKRLDAMSRFSSSDAFGYAFRRVMPQHFSMQLGESGGRAYSLQSEKEFSDAVKKQPEKYNSKHPLRGVAKLGSGKYAFVLDDNDSDSGKYDRLYFDKNHNGDLTDDEPIAAEQSVGNSSQYVQSTFPRVDLVIDVDGGKLDYAMQASAFAYKQSKDSTQVSASFSACAYREGDVTLEGKKHHLVVLDYNSNGRFGDQARTRDEIRMASGEIYPEIGDMLMLDPSQEKMGYAYYYPTAGSMWQFLSKLVNVDGKFYDVAISPSGDKITLSPSPLDVGQVINPGGPFHAIVYGEHGFLKIDGDGKAPVRLPEGQWKLLSYTIDRTEYPTGKEDSQGEAVSLLKKLADLLSGNSPVSGPRYSVVTASATSEYKAVKVTKDGTVALPFGPPYKPIAKVGYKQSKGQVQLQMSLVGSAGEVCQDMRVDGRRPGTPRFTITDPKGKEIVSGSFEYG